MPLKLVSCVAAVAAVLTAAGASAGPAAPSACPAGLLPLTSANPIGAASAAALRAMKASDRPQVTGAMFAIHDQQRGPQAKTMCGTRVRQRTVVVYVTARAALPAQSASQRVFFVGRFASGYRVWYVVH